MSQDKALKTRRTHDLRKLCLFIRNNSRPLYTLHIASCIEGIHITRKTTSSFISRLKLMEVRHSWCEINEAMLRIICANCENPFYACCPLRLSSGDFWFIVSMPLIPHRDKTIYCSDYFSVSSFSNDRNATRHVQHLVAIQLPVHTEDLYIARTFVGNVNKCNRFNHHIVHNWTIYSDLSSI